jgi:hypothetical protein
MSEQMEIEREKLEKAVDKFAGQLKERLFQKLNEGFTGWDDEDLNQRNIMRRLNEKVNHIIFLEQDAPQKAFFDVAIFSMFLLNNFTKKINERRNQKKGTTQIGNNPRCR